MKQQIALVKQMTRNLKTITPTTTAAAAATLTRAFKEQQRKLYTLQNPEAKALFSTEKSLACFNMSDECTQAMFKPFKAIAKQNWVNKLKKADWKEGEEPNIQGVTNSVTEVAEEFTKYYQMLYAKKKIDETELRKVIRLMERKKLLKASSR